MKFTYIHSNKALGNTSFHWENSQLYTLPQMFIVYQLNKAFFFSHRVIWEVHICCGIPQSHLRLILSTQFFKQLCKEAMKVGKPYSTSKGYKKNLN